MDSTALQRKKRRRVSDADPPRFCAAYSAPAEPEPRQSSRKKSKRKTRPSAKSAATSDAKSAVTQLDCSGDSKSVATRQRKVPSPMSAALSVDAEDVLDNSRAKCGSLVQPEFNELFAESAPRNRDAIARRQWEARVLPAFRAARWDWPARETRVLEEAVRAQLQEDLFRCRYTAASAGMESIEEKKRVFLQVCSDLRSQDVQCLMEEHERMLDWMGVAEKLNLSMGPPIGKSSVTVQQFPRSATNCLIHYLHSIDERVDRGTFTEEEIQNVKELARIYGGFDWEEVAMELDTRRTSWQCFAAYQACVRAATKLRQRRNTAVRRALRRWTWQEDRRLLLADRVYGSLPKQRRLLLLPGRQYAHYQARRRILQAKASRELHGPWSKSEDNKLLELARAHGQDWTLICLQMKGRSKRDCQLRYRQQRPKVRVSTSSSIDARQMLKVKKHTHPL